MQVKLYRVLQEGKVRPLGSTDELDVDVRVIAATNRDLQKAISSGEFREDLFYRLSVIPLHVPALRDRREDIPLLALHFLESFRSSMGKKIDGISPEAMRRLESYDWPGNVRELENTIERAVALESASEISVTVLPERMVDSSVANAVAAGQPNGVQIPPEGIDFERVVSETEKRYLQAALEKAGGVRTQAAEILKISYRSFRHYAKKHAL
jgi:two-component system response regulator PilR (NtrC family)